ncbi:MAG: GTPase HflX [Brevinema sp.]
MTPIQESYFLVGLKLPKDDPQIIEDSMSELEGLVETAGGKVVGSIIQNRSSIDPVYYIGQGKLDEIDMLFDRKEGEKGALIFNASLSPSQIRNIEEKIECRVITRTELILDIFALRAQSRIAKLQVETAQLSYLLPRLVGKGATMSRTGAGIGTRGPGETKLETDRRKINNRLAILKRELKHLEKASNERRKSRDSVFKVAVAGYTNVGKSSLATHLVQDSFHAENKLFATIDTTTRRLSLGGIEAVITDTVGFIRDIPHELIESFKSTLAETIHADLILHVVDLSSPFFLNNMETAQELFEELSVESPTILVFNKIDLIDAEQLLQARINFPDAFFVSVKAERGITQLRDMLKDEAIKFLKSQNREIPDWIQYQNHQ